MFLLIMTALFNYCNVSDFLQNQCRQLMGSRGNAGLPPPSGPLRSYSSGIHGPFKAHQYYIGLQLARQRGLDMAPRGEAHCNVCYIPWSISLETISSIKLLQDCGHVRTRILPTAMMRRKYVIVTAMLPFGFSLDMRCSLVHTALKEKTPYRFQTQVIVIFNPLPLCLSRIATSVPIPTSLLSSAHSWQLLNSFRV